MDQTQRALTEGANLRPKKLRQQIGKGIGPCQKQTAVEAVGPPSHAPGCKTSSPTPAASSTGVPLVVQREQMMCSGPCLLFYVFS